MTDIPEYRYIEQSLNPPLAVFGQNFHLVYIVASFVVLFEKNSASNYLKRQIGPSPKDKVLFSFR